MIATPTVFVLGAGASKPFKYPTGVELRTAVLKGVGKHVSLTDFLDAEGLGDARMRFAEALARSAQKSVDAFLEHRREFEKVGKLAMAYILMGWEDEGNLFSDEEIPRNWLIYLLSAMSGPFDSFGNNAVSFITFNYDRVLEHVLFNAVKHRYGKSDEDCAAVLEKIPIVHVHGSLGPLPWQEAGGRPYGKVPLPPPEVKLAADRIKIVYEGAEEDPEFNQARALIREAKRIYFLGFGYNKDNVERLHLGECRQPYYQMYGSALGFSEREREDVRALLNAQIGPAKKRRPSVSLYDGDCLQFLRNKPVRLD